MTTLEFSQVIIYTFDKNSLPAARTISVPANKVWKIESAGIGGSNGTIFLRTDFGSPVVPDTNVAMLFSSIGTNSVNGSHLPFSLPAGFTGNFFIDTDNVATVSVTEYSIVTIP